MRAIYECPYCGAQNIVPDNTIGLSYLCYNCGNEFSVIGRVNCPACGTFNVLNTKSPSDRYSCHACGYVFNYTPVSNIPEENTKPVQTTQSIPRPQVVRKSQSDAIVDLLISPVSALFKMFNYRGRASRAEFGGSLGLMFLCWGVLVHASTMNNAGDSAGLVIILTLLTTISFTACMERRAHDCEQEEVMVQIGTWFIITFVCVLITLPVFLFYFVRALAVLLFTEGVPYRNEHGDPA